MLRFPLESAPRVASVRGRHKATSAKCQPTNCQVAIFVFGTTLPPATYYLLPAACYPLLAQPVAMLRLSFMKTRKLMLFSFLSFGQAHTKEARECHGSKFAALKAMTGQTKARSGCAGSRKIRADDARYAW